MNLFPVRSRRPSKSCNVDRKPRIGKCFCLLLSIYPIFILFEAQYYARLSRTEKMSFYNNEVIQLTELIPTEINRTRLNSNATKDPLYIKLKYTSDKGTQSLVNIFERLYFNFDILDCDRDVTLLQPRETKERFFVAVNLKDNEDIMPNFIVQMLTLVSLFDEDRIRISIYESGSVDSTPQWLIFLGKLLDVVGVRHKIVPYGNLVRQRKVDRIPFLSSVRNAAMEPLQEWQDTWIATKVVFINDVFFCAQHVLRLARHDADLACGMDFTHCVPCLKVSTQLQLMKADLLTNYKFSASQTKWIMKSGYFRSWWRKRIKHDTKRLKDLGAPMAFYDKWVSHDIQGNSFLNPAPYTKDLETIESFQKGRPVYVYSCWNGLVAINPEPFYRNLAFRKRFPEECGQSECFNLCHDMRLLGYDRILIDPGVRLSYTYNEAVILYDPEIVREIAFLPWDNEEILFPKMNLNKHPLEMECCALEDTHEDVDFDHDCHPVDYSKLNCSLRAMGQIDHCTSVIS